MEVVSVRPVAIVAPTDGVTRTPVATGEEETSRGMIAGMDLEELRALLAVAERGSFLAAATDLRVPRGTLRRQIDALEARAGVLLLERSARGVTLTRAGELLCARGRALLDEGAALLAAVRASAREEQGPLRIQAPIGLPPEAVVNFVRLARTFAPERSWRLKICLEPAAHCDDADIALYLGDAAPPTGW